MDVSLRYGPGAMTLRLPEGNVAGVVRPVDPEPAGEPSLPESTRNALGRVCRGRRVLVLASDATRPPLAPPLQRAAFAALAGARSVAVHVATGSHRADTPANAAALAALRDAACYAGLPPPGGGIHDCRAAAFTDHGVTARGTPVRLSRVLDDADVFLVLADVKPHYFAGYSNPLKFFLPGVAEFGTIEHNHRLALEPDSRAGRHPFHPDPARRTNPVAEDMLEAFERMRAGRDAFALVTVTAGGRRVHADLGPFAAACAGAFAASDRIASVAVTPRRRVVVSAGGAPQDATLYLAQRALELTRDAVADGGEVLLLASCADGIADGASAMTNFYEELRRPLPDVLRRIRAGYRLYQHKAFRFAELLGRLRAVHVTSALPAETLTAVHLTPAPDPQALLDRWLAEDPASRVLFLDEANKLDVRAA